MYINIVVDLIVHIYSSRNHFFPQLLFIYIFLVKDFKYIFHTKYTVRKYLAQGKNTHSATHQKLG